MSQEIKLEQQLKSAIAKNDDAKANELLTSLLANYPHNTFLNHCLIKNLYRNKNYNDCLNHCYKILQSNSMDEVVLQLIVLCEIACKNYKKASVYVKKLLDIEGDNVQYLLLKAEIELALNNFNIALEIYKRIAELDESFFGFKTLPNNRIIQQHIINARNLCKRKAFEMVSVCKGISKRLDLAVDGFFGLTNLVKNNKFQQPSFFYLPQLTAKPFYDLTDIPELESIIKALKTNINEIRTIIKTNSSQKYLDTIPTKNNASEWVDLNKKWDSIHLIKGGEVIKEQKIKDSLLNIFNDNIIANCPPHAPEVFLSTLQPEAKIPPHYGLSNIKLTVHLPIFSDKKSFIKVGDDIRNWVDDEFLIFDDSFIHLAENHSKESRTVLIFDIWHPDLSIEEREGIRSFMAIYQKWNEKYKNIL